MRLTDEQLSTELTAMRETPSESFAAELDAWAAEGFPSVKQLEPTRRRFGFVMRRPMLAAAAAGLVVIAVIAVSVASYLERNNGVDSGAEPLSAGQQLSGLRDQSKSVEVGPQSGSAAASTVVPAPVPPPTGRPRNGRPQVQERSASVGLATEADKLGDAANGVVDVTERYDGIVDSSTVHAAGSNGHASFSLRIPTQHLNDALTDLSGLGRVTTRDTGSTNVTGAYVDAGKAYADARAKVDSLLEDLRNASRPSEAASIKQQLVVAREQLAAARAALRGLKQHVALTPVNVQITAQGDGNWSIGDAADDAVNVLEAIGGALLIALAVLLPLAALVALGWLGARELRRRQREAPLDR
jgi:hypothetical protein